MTPKCCHFEEGSAVKYVKTDRGLLSFFSQVGSSCMAKLGSLASVVLLLSGASLVAEDWPNWRGPLNNGISSEKYRDHLVCGQERLVENSPARACGFDTGHLGQSDFPHHGHREWRSSGLGSEYQRWCCAMGEDCVQ